MNNDIKELHVSWGDYSWRYRVGEELSSPGWGVITKIKWNQHRTMQYDILTYDIYARKTDLDDDGEYIAKRIEGLPVELTYKP